MDTDLPLERVDGEPDSDGRNLAVRDKTSQRSIQCPKTDTSLFAMDTHRFRSSEPLVRGADGE